MQDTELNGTQSLVNKYYQEEQERALRERSLAELRIRLPVSDLAMLNMIARRFGKSRDELSSDVMASALLDIFSRLDAGERKLLARDADEKSRQLANEIAEENGVSEIDSRPGFWSNQEKLISREEKRRARIQEKMKQSTDAIDDAEESSADEYSEVTEVPSPDAGEE